MFHFWKLHQNLNILKKKMIVIAILFWKLQTVKDLVRPLSKKHRFRTSFETQHVKLCQTLVKSASEEFHQIFSSLWENLIWKVSLLLSYLLNHRVFRNTLTANDKYHVGDCENLSSPIQMQISLEPNSSSDSFVPFLKSPSNFKHLQKKDDRHSYFVLEITDC